MKILSYVLICITLASGMYFTGCDDSGNLPVEEKAGQVKFTQNVKLLPLDPVNDGYYNLWLILKDSLGTPRSSHLGRFNVLPSGDVVDENGNPKTFSVIAADTVDLARAFYSIISIDLLPVTDPGPTRILAGPVNVYLDSVSARLKINDTLAVGSAMTYALIPRSVLYIINTPTSGPGNCGKGVWLCDQNGVNSWPDGTNLRPGWGWHYRGWVHNKTTDEYFNTGSFYDEHTFDSDGAGPCADTLGPAYDKPGQDWAKTGCSNVTNIFDGNHEVFVTLEPESRQGNIPPFVLKLFYQPNVSPTLGCNRRDNMFTQYGNIPDISLKVTR